MNAPARPTKDAAFFALLAEDSDWMLVAAAMIAATRRDFDALNGLVDFLMASGAQNYALMNNPTYNTNVPKNPKENPSPMVMREDSRLTMAFATAFCVQNDAGGFLRSPSPPEAIALAQRVCELYNAPFCENFALLRHMDRLLHDASSCVADPRIFKLLVDAGASPDVASTSQRFKITGKTHPLLEAVTRQNWEATHQIATSMDGLALHTFVCALLSVQSKPGATPSSTFSGSPGVVQMVAGLRSEPDMLGQLLSIVDTGIQQAQPPDSSRTMPLFRMQLAASFLGGTAVGGHAGATDEQMTALLGRPGDAIHQGVKSLLDSFAREPLEPRTTDDLEDERWKEAEPYSDGGLKYIHVEANFLYQALRTHCVPAISISQEVMVAAAESKGPGPWQAIGVGLWPSQSVFSPESFRSTLALLQEAGWDLNALPQGNNALHVLATVDGEHMFSMLPIVLDFGVDDDARDAFHNVPTQNIKGANTADQLQKRDRWQFVVKSHAARKTVHHLIDEMDLEDNDPRKSAP